MVKRGCELKRAQRRRAEIEMCCVLRVLWQVQVCQQRRQWLEEERQPARGTPLRYLMLTAAVAGSGDDTGSGWLQCCVL